MVRHCALTPRVCPRAPRKTEVPTVRPGPPFCEGLRLPFRWRGGGSESGRRRPNAADAEDSAYRFGAVGPRRIAVGGVCGCWHESRAGNLRSRRDRVGFGDGPGRPGLMENCLPCVVGICPGYCWLSYATFRPTNDCIDEYCVGCRTLLLGWCAVRAHFVANSSSVEVGLPTADVF